MIRRLILLFLTLQVLPSSAALNLVDLANLTGSPEYMQGDFKQEKLIQSFGANIQSSGHFAYKKNQYMHWNTVLPVENQMVMTPTSISSKQGDNELVRLQADDHPTIKVLSKIFFAVLTAEWQTLDDYFSSAIEGEAANWTVKLTPKNNLLNQSVNHVELFGDKLLKEVILYEKNGDTTHIFFSNVTHETP